MDESEYQELRERFLRRLPRPLDALAQLTDTRATLDRLEPLLVQEARRSYSTWEEIGGALGISRQAAHRRHSGLVNRKSGV